MDDMKKLTDKVEYLFLKILLGDLDSQSITVEEMKSSAKDFLTLEPFISIDDARSKVNSLVTRYPRYSELKEYMAAYEKELRTEAVIEKMRAHMKSNNLDEALKVAQS
jgi:hypothetical protein